MCGAHNKALTGGRESLALINRQRSKGRQRKLQVWGQLRPDHRELERVGACEEPLRHEVAYTAVAVIVVPVNALSSSDFLTLCCVPELLKAL